MAKRKGLKSRNGQRQRDLCRFSPSVQCTAATQLERDNVKTRKENEKNKKEGK